MIENIYSKYDIEMAECTNIESFFERIKRLGGEMGKSSDVLFNEISKDLESTYQHIISQQITLDHQMRIFKDTVFNIEVIKKVKNLLGDWNQQYLNELVDGENMGNRNTEALLSGGMRI
jgi:hypothetical protein